MTLPSYTELAARLNIRQCRGINPVGHECPFDHRLGEYVVVDATIHWADRRPTYAGIRAFLWVVAWRVNDRTAEELTQPYWLRFYRAQKSLTRLAMLVRVRIPKHLSDEDRAKMKALIANVPRSVPGREEARLWARR